jgi:soluble lytic murein transglycosylase-like protein
MSCNRFFKESDLQRTVKHGLIFYFIVAMLAVPSALCSRRPLQAPTSPAFTPIVDLSPAMSDTPQLLPLTIAPQESEKATLTSAADDAAQNDDAQNDVVEPAQDEPPFYEHIIQAAQAYHVDPALIRAIIMTESSYNPQAVSKRGARGLMQLMPTTAKAMGIKDSFDPALNIDGGVRYLRRLLDRFEGDVRLALAAYNAGSRYVHKYGGVPPFRATRRYIKKVLHYQKQFKSEMAAGNSSGPSV